MVGAKQFAIHRKVSTVKRINPLLAAISMPAFMKSNEAELHKRDAFVPSTESFSLAKLIQNKSQVTRRDRPQVTSNVTQKAIVSNEKEEPSKSELISDELANMITCKVLKNIKDYLNPPRESSMGLGMGRHIKLEISL